MSPERIDLPDPPGYGRVQPDERAAERDERFGMDETPPRSALTGCWPALLASAAVWVVLVAAVAAAVRWL